jgi:hypothetical protein
MTNEQKNWKLIEATNWKSDHSYRRIEVELSSLDDNTFKELKEFVHEKAKTLSKTYYDAWLGRDGGPGFDVSDDSWSDLVYDVVGRGEDFYNSITADKLRGMASNDDYQESFSYCFQR